MAKQEQTEELGITTSNAEGGALSSYAFASPSGLAKLEAMKEQ